MEYLTDQNLRPEVAAQLSGFLREIKALKEQEKRLNEALLAEMEAKGIVKVETDEILINYIAPTERETLDTKSLRSELPDIYDAYVRMNPVKASVRIKLK